MELLVVIAILAILLALLLPAVQKVREAANRLVCGSHLRQLAIGIHAFEQDHGRLPYNTQRYALGDWSWEYHQAQRNWSWLARLLPYIEQDALYRRGNIPQNTFGQSRAALATPIPLLFCPSDDARHRPVATDRNELGGQPIALTNYKGVSGSNWCWGDWVFFGPSGSCDGLHLGDGLFWREDQHTPLRLGQIRDGTSNTFMIGEDLPAKNAFCSWPYANHAVGTCGIGPNARRADGAEYPVRDWENVYSFRSRHPGGLQFAYADGSVRYVKNHIALSIYRALASRAGGEVVADD
jgi:prepilin-type processing-associated H-X9-DG protein